MFMAGMIGFDTTVCYEDFVMKIDRQLADLNTCH